MRVRKDTPWQEVNSSQEGYEHVMRVVLRNQKITFAQATAIEHALGCGNEVWATYASPVIAHGVRVKWPTREMEKELLACGFKQEEFKYNPYRRWQFTMILEKDREASF